MKFKLLLSGMIVIAVVLAMSGCISSYDKNVQNSSTGKVPAVSAYRTNNTTVTIIYLDANGAKDVKGLQVVSPTISSPIVIDLNTSVPSGKEIKVTDPNLAGKVNLVVTMSVDGTNRIVLNGSI